MSFYKTLSESPEQIYARFIAIPRDAENYYRIRFMDAENLDEITRSAHFLFLNRNCFNGIFRTNIKGEFNVPFASHRVAPYPTQDEIRRSASALSGARLRCDDFEAVCLDETRKGDLVYLDPPYYVPSTRVFREYSSKPFAEDDLRRLGMVLEEIDNRGALFLLSYPECELIAPMARRWSSSQISVRRTIAGSLKSRGYAPELLIYNFRPSLDS